MHHEPTPVFEHMAELSFHTESAGDAWDDWKRGDAPVGAVTSELYEIARAAFAAARQLRADDAVVTTEDLFAEPAFQAAHAGQVADPFDDMRAQINALPEANDS